ncbi:MAG: CoB--CoM heterodisulfide reductase iron-sulfur subunit A family protein [Planctomycetes bacterium]|nr:CoB--CoM heterodisulfide reductase iron-sulfur subunit A family protein [Planctomycetota bacterium]
MSKIGVFVCHCGENISRTVDVEKVRDVAQTMKGVVHAEDYKYMCSSVGQNLIKKAIKEKGLTGVVVACCSPKMHEPTFRNASNEAKLNPYLCEIANIREQCSWVHEDKAIATPKAIDLTRLMVEKVRQNSALSEIKVPLTKKALVIGGGVAGIQTALDIADGGHQVILVEKTPSIGGRMAGLSETFPTLDCSQCILTPKMVDCARHKNIKLYTYSEIEEVKGYLGNFEVTIRKKARFVKEDVCTGCGLCYQKCPQKKIPSEFDEYMGNRTSIYVPFPQAVPNIPVIDKNTCTKLLKNRCGLCEKVCPPGAIDYTQQDELITEKVGSIVVATGYELIPNNLYGEYGYGKYKDVINGLQFERLVSASGPTKGEIKRPSDGKVPETIVFIQCVGSRDPAKGITYCSKICCMYTAKQTMLYKHKVHHGQAYVFYIDIRAGGKGYEEFVLRAIEEDGAIYLRGRVSRIFRKPARQPGGGDKLVVRGMDTLSAKKVEIEADMVVLASAMTPPKGIETLYQKLGTSYDSYHWLSEAHPKLRPVETTNAGIFLAGACQAPKDIPDAVAQASGAASKVLALFSKDILSKEGTVARINELLCTGCQMCINACPYKAIELKDINDRQGKLVRQVARVNEGLCQGCGVCVAVCPSKCPDLAGITEEQVYAELMSLA